MALIANIRFTLINNSKLNKAIKMAKHIMKCLVCGSYTMKEKCCNKATARAKPAKYSPEDKYARYRREAKKSMLIEKGII